MSETVAALGELIASADEVADTSTSYLIGQLAAELVASTSEKELIDAIVTINVLQQGVDGEASPLRRSFLAMLLGLLNGVLADRQSARANVQLTVRERVLNLLAIGPQNPTSLAAEIGCPPATVSRALTRLREDGFVDYYTNSEPGDGRNRTYQLTAKGKKRQDDRFLGRQSDDEADISKGDDHQKFDYAHLLEPLTGVVAELNSHDPAIAAALYPGLDALIDQVSDPELREAAVSELGAQYQGNPDVAAVEQAYEATAH